MHMEKIKMINMKRIIIVLWFCLPGVINASAQCEWDAYMQQMGLVDVQTLDSTIRVQLRYSTTDNFMQRDVYGCLEKAYLEKGFAQKVVRAHRLLKAMRPGYRLLIYDAARPISVQRAMYALVAGTPNRFYVANGRYGGRHNYGVAVDVTITDAEGNVADMGTPFDHFGEAAHTGAETDKLLAKRKLISREAVKNRRLLRQVMAQVGLVPYRREWWHYEEPMSMPDTRRKYRLLDK